MKKRFAAVAGAMFAFGVIVACSSSDDATAPPSNEGSCAKLASQCHPYAQKSALANECHELGHAGDDSKCGPRLAECQAECPLTDAGESDLPFEIGPDGEVIDKRHDAAANDANTDGSDGAPQISQACVDYCACLEPTCGFQKADYKYTSIGQCQEACMTFEADELDCWSKFCNHAKTLSEANRQHECQHSIGVLGLFECPYGE